jgi:cytoskeletal protein CcmA (bactofilin family)
MGFLDRHQEKDAMLNKQNFFGNNSNSNDRVRRDLRSGNSNQSSDSSLTPSSLTNPSGVPASSGPSSASTLTAAPASLGVATVADAPKFATSSDAAKPKTATEEAKGSRLIVGPDIKLKGAEITDCDTLVVEGRVEASMDSRVIQIAENGSFQGKVGIDIAEIHGDFEGELTARKQLIIHSTGRVSGIIRYGKLVIAEGGELAGDVASLSSGSKSTTQSSKPAAVHSSGTH